ncbi:hypothetical protein EDB89DRAFT_2082022 [Lactarius sanguifluus]|nr:hypothetical protein EDB89DRAFT_2082022 [Lactarius sanguifluus]
MVLVRYDANAVWSRYDSDSAPRCDTDAAPQQLGAATRRHATTPTPRRSNSALRLGATTPTPRRSNTLRRRMVMLRQQLGAEPLRHRRRAAATRRRHANSDAAWSRCDSDTPPATSANDSDAALQQYGAATEID